MLLHYLVIYRVCNRLFSYINVSQGNVATYAMYAMYSEILVTILLQIC